MMDTNDPKRDPQLLADLLGYHLGLTDEADNRRVEAAFGVGESLASSRRAVQRFLAPLELDEAPSAPADLVQRVLGRVEATGRTLPLRRGPALAAPPETGGGRGPLMNVRELLGLAAAILIFVGIFVPGYHSARMASQRAACAGNLRDISAGYGMYQAAFDGGLPFAGFTPKDATWLPTDRPGVRSFRNSRNSYILVKLGFADPKSFVCPGREGDFAQATPVVGSLNDFPSPRNSSYATYLGSGPASQANCDPIMPIVADMNPLFDARSGHDPGSGLPENSLSHGEGKGQNVARMDGSMFWAPHPRVGIDSDDIYRLIGVQEYTGTERPRQRSDAFLVP